jgi:putative tryptophan/tyrosine transport system substrate-binding protein
VAAYIYSARATERADAAGWRVDMPENDPELQKWVAAFHRGLEKLGWSEGRNIQFDYRFAPAGSRAPTLAKELLALHPDVILAFSTPVAAAFQRETTRSQSCSSASLTCWAMWENVTSLAIC